MLDKQADPARSKDRIHPQAVARAVSDLAKPDAVFTLDTGLNTLWSGNWIRATRAVAAYKRHKADRIVAEAKPGRRHG